MKDVLAIIERVYSFSQRVAPSMTKREFSELLLASLADGGYQIKKTDGGPE